jgi:hypothetical protein
MSSFFCVSIHEVLMILRIWSFAIWSTPVVSIWLIDWLIFLMKKKEGQTNRHWMTVDVNVSICTYDVLNLAQVRMSFTLFLPVSCISCLGELIFVQVSYDSTSDYIQQTKLGPCVVCCWQRLYKQLWRKMITAGVMRQLCCCVG